MPDSYYWPPKFDPDASFEVAAWPIGFTVNGKQPKSGEPFDKSSVRELRILRELYEKRWIKMVRPFAQLVEQINAPAKRRGGRPRKYPANEANA